MSTGAHEVGTAASAPDGARPGQVSGRVTGSAGASPIAFLPCRLDEHGGLAEVLMAELADGRTALLGYSALDRFVQAWGPDQAWVLWLTEDLPRLREAKHYDVAYLDAPLPRGIGANAHGGTP